MLRTSPTNKKKTKHSANKTNLNHSAYKYLTSSSLYNKSIVSNRKYGGQQFISPYQCYHPLTSYNANGPIEIHSTTIICVRKDDEIVMVGDGQMTIGSVVAKPNGRKLRKLNNDKAVCGFAGIYYIMNW